MFANKDITQYICRFLESCDVFDLMMVDKNIHDIISQLFTGATIDDRRIINDIEYSITSIPLLDIEESIPISVKVGAIIYDVTTLARIRDLNAETICVISPVHPAEVRYIYIKNGYVKFIVNVLVNIVSLLVLVPIVSIKLVNILKLINKEGLVCCSDKGLEANISMRGVINLCWDTTIRDINFARDFNTNILTSKKFLRFAAEYNG